MKEGGTSLDDGLRRAVQGDPAVNHAQGGISFVLAQEAKLRDSDQPFLSWAYPGTASAQEHTGCYTRSLVVIIQRQVEQGPDGVLVAHFKRAFLI